MEGLSPRRLRPRTEGPPHGLGVPAMMEEVTARTSTSYTIAEAAALAGLHKNTIRHKVRLGQLEAETRHGKFGEEYRIPHDALVRAGLIEGVLESAELAPEEPGPLALPDDVEGGDSLPAIPELA